MDYQTSWLARQFAQNVFYHHISVDQFKLTLHHPHLPVIEIHVDAISMGRVNGFFWDTLILYEQNHTHIFGGLSSDGCEKIFNEILHQQTNLKKTKTKSRASLDELRVHLESAYEETRNFANTTHYIQHPVAETWLSQNLLYFEALQQAKELKLLTDIELSWYETLAPFLLDGHHHFKLINQRFVEQEVERFNHFFDNIEFQPLTKAQRISCVVNEQFNLVLAGAGTGKTSTMIARAGYILQAKLANPEQILMLAYANKAAEEMHDRVESRLNTTALNVKTFHSLGLSILSQVDGRVPNINDMAADEILKAKFIDNEIKRLLTTEKYKSALVDYFFYHHLPYKSQYDFKSLGEYTEYMLENEIISLQGEKVKSFEECEIANFLYRNGIPYQYEASYKIDTRDQNHKQYQPDFYLIEADIYIEHFCIDIAGKTPPFIKQQAYLDGMAWKRKLHQQHQTKLIETYSYLKQQGRLTQYLVEKLQENGVKFQPLSQNKLLDNLTNKGLVSEFSKLIAQILSLFKLSGRQQLFINKGQSSSQSTEAIQHLFEPIFNAYQQELTKTDSIDFDDMILRATKYAHEGKYKSPFLHILVDEFQDISEARANLIRALLAQQQDATLFCVGDDWQSIYRFAGSNIGLMNHFEEQFGHAATNILDKTFRFNNKINEVAARFIQQNPDQLKKEIVCHHQMSTEAISIIKTSEMERGIIAALDAIQQKTENSNVSVLILSRFSHSKPDLRRLRAQFSNMQIGFMTVHASKGKEADFVILTDLTKGKFGFPSEKNSHPIIESLLPNADNYLNAEERRLFYVALTRAKHHVHLLTHPHRSSNFVRELIHGGYPVALMDENCTLQNADNFLPNSPCPACKTGFLTPRDSHSSFLGCSHYPYCHYTQQACQCCGGETYLESAFLRCKNKHCDFKVPKCPSCETGVLKIRSRNGRKFWGCSNYRKDSEFSCMHTSNFIDLNH